MNTSTDVIEKRVLLRAPVARVWRAIADAREFGQWFGVTLEGEMTPGSRLRGSFGKGFSAEKIEAFQSRLGLAPSKVRLPADGAWFCTVERVEPPGYFSFRWVPFGIDAEADPEREATTLVEFRLAEAPGGCELTITESGFDRVPAHRRHRAFTMNSAGWSGQAESIRKHVEAG